MVGINYLKALQGSAREFYSPNPANAKADRLRLLETTLEEGEEGEIDVPTNEILKETDTLLSQEKQSRKWISLPATTFTPAIPLIPTLFTPTTYDKLVAPLKSLAWIFGATVTGGIAAGVARAEGEPSYIPSALAAFCMYSAYGNYKSFRANLLDLDSLAERQKWRKLAQKIPLAEFIDKLKKHKMRLNGGLEQLGVNQLISYRLLKPSEPTYLSQERRKLFYGCIKALSKEFDSLSQVHEVRLIKIRRTAKTEGERKQLEAEACQRKDETRKLLEKQFRALEESLKTTKEAPKKIEAISAPVAPAGPLLPNPSVQKSS